MVVIMASPAGPGREELQADEGHAEQGKPHPNPRSQQQEQDEQEYHHQIDVFHDLPRIICLRFRASMGGMGSEQDNPHEIVDQGNREHHRTGGHRKLRNPDRRCIQSLGDVAQPVRPVNRLDRVIGPEDRQGRSHRKAPELAPAPCAPQGVQQHVHPYVASVVERIGECKEGGGGHEVAGIVGGAGKDFAGPSRDHLHGDDRQDGNQAEGGKIAAQQVHPVQRPPQRVPADVSFHFLSAGCGPAVASAGPEGPMAR